MESKLLAQVDPAELTEMGRDDRGALNRHPGECLGFDPLPLRITGGT